MTFISLPKTLAGRLRVIKTLGAGDRGALKLARRYGGALICVRHRTDASGRTRFTTVELLVESAEIQTRSDREVAVRVNYSEKALRQAVRDAGGRWDPVYEGWRVPMRVVQWLKVDGGIIKT